MNTTEKSLREIVSENFNSASVLEKYGLDFCCKGGVSLKEACETKNLDLAIVSAELSQVSYDDTAQRYFGWSVPFLADYIVNNHHAYVKNQTPLIGLHFEKVVRAHGERHPEVKEAQHIFHLLSRDLLHHMAKEEQILFPFIKQLAETETTTSRAPFGSVSVPIAVMLSEHEDAGKAAEHLRDLLDDFTPPADACTTMRLLYKELDAYELDLHKHVFLENTVLFPKAKLIESTLSEGSRVQ